jgi:hypothetical protein
LLELVVTSYAYDFCRKGSFPVGDGTLTLVTIDPFAQEEVHKYRCQEATNELTEYRCQKGFRAQNALQSLHQGDCRVEHCSRLCHKNGDEENQQDAQCVVG